MYNKQNLYNPNYSPPDLLLVPKHTSIKIKSLNLKTQSFTVQLVHTIKCTLQLKSPNLESLSLVKLNLIGATNISSNCHFSYTGQLLIISWDKPFIPSEERRLEINYDVIKPIAGVYFSNDNLNYCITDHETEKCRYWLACIDHPSVLSTYDFEFEVLNATEATTILANGILSYESFSNGIKKSYWNFDSQLCPSYLLCFCVGEFNSVAYDYSHLGSDAVLSEYRKRFNLPELKCFSTKDHCIEDLRLSFKSTPYMITWIQDHLKLKLPLLNTFNYDADGTSVSSGSSKYYQVSAWCIQGSAMENVSLVTWSHRCIMSGPTNKSNGNKKNFSERRWLMESTNIHEMAHSYFGNFVVCKAFEHVWLKESFATFMETWWYLSDYVQRESGGIGQWLFEYDLWINQKSYFAECDNRYSRIMINKGFDTSWQMFDSHTYPGGAWRLHMLCCLVGPDVFWAGVRNYLLEFGNHFNSNEKPSISYKLGETNDFKKSIEQVSKLNLIRWFDQWFYSKGYPSLKATYNFKNETKIVEVTIEQIQTQEFPLFHFKFQIELVFDDNSVINQMIEFDSDSRKVSVTFRVEKEPSQVLIDPGTTVLFKLEFNPGPSILKNIVHYGKNIRCKLFAYRELIKEGSYVSIDIVREAIKKEKFFGVRDEVAFMLSEEKNHQQLNLLADMIEWETDDAVLWKMLGYSKIRNEKLRNSLLKVLKNDIGDRAISNALVAIGSQRNKEDLSLLMIHYESGIRGQHNLIRGSVFEGLHYFGSESDMVEQIFPILYEASSSDKEHHIHARPMAITSLAKFVTLVTGMNYKGYYKKTLTLLEEIALEETYITVRKAAIDAIVILEANESVETLIKAKRFFPEQDWFIYDGKISKLRKSQDNQKANDIKRIEDLENQVRLLQDRIKKIENK